MLPGIFFFFFFCGYLILFSCFVSVYLFMCLFAKIFCLWWHFFSSDLPSGGEDQVLALLVLNVDISLCGYTFIFSDMLFPLVCGLSSHSFGRIFQRKEDFSCDET